MEILITIDVIFVAVLAFRFFVITMPLRTGELLFDTLERVVDEGIQTLSDADLEKIRRSRKWSFCLSYECKVIYDRSMATLVRILDRWDEIQEEVEQEGIYRPWVLDGEVFFINIEADICHLQPTDFPCHAEYEHFTETWQLEDES